METHACKICGKQVVMECFDYDECDNNKRPVDPLVICGFEKAWVGKCKNPVHKDGDKCEEHQMKCCSCGEPATHECDETGQFVCGAPLCDDCTHNTHPEGHNGGVGFNALKFPEGIKTHGKKSEQKYAPWYIDAETFDDWKKENGIPDHAEVELTGSR